MSDIPRRFHVVPPSRSAGVPALLDEVQTLLAQLREHHRTLEYHPDPGGPTEAVVQALVHRRDALASRLGKELVRCLATGGTVRVVPSTTRVAPHAARWSDAS